MTHSPFRRPAAAALAALLGGAALSGGSAAATTRPAPPAWSVQHAEAGAGWLARQLNTQGFVTGKDGMPALSDTVDAVLALQAAGVARTATFRAVGYVRVHAQAYIDRGGSDGAAQLAKLVLIAAGQGLSTRTFGGGSDLLTRLRATQRTTGPDRGLYGAQDPSFDGVFREGLVLTALAAAGAGRDGVGLAWLTRQQCADGGFLAYRADTATPCVEDPASFTTEDTNSTALAVTALAANGQPVGRALDFFAGAQHGDGGWSFDRTAGSPTEPNSTGVVVSALLAAGQNPGRGRWARVGGTPYKALALLQKGCAAAPADRGAYVYPGLGINVLAAAQAVPAAAGKTLPLGRVTLRATVPVLACGKR